jgi:hypothetical protein
MNCNINTNNDVVGSNVSYTISYVPLVSIYANTVVQVQMQPWGAYSLSNFVTTNTATICNGACTLSVPASNANIS